MHTARSTPSATTATDIDALSSQQAISHEQLSPMFVHKSCVLPEAERHWLWTEWRFVVETSKNSEDAFTSEEEMEAVEGLWILRVSFVTEGLERRASIVCR